MEQNNFETWCHTVMEPNMAQSAMCFYHQSNPFSHFSHIICASRSVPFTVYYVPVDFGWWSHAQCISWSSHTFGVGQFIQRAQLTVDISDGLNNSVWQCMHTVSKLRFVWFILSGFIFWVDLESDSIKRWIQPGLQVISKIGSCDLIKNRQITSP